MSTNSSSSARPGLNAPLSAAEAAREAEWRADLEAAFEEGVELAFSRWEALNIALNNMSGPDVNQIVDEFITTAVDWFLDEKEPLHWDEVEGWLAEVLANEFHIDAQDGSPEQIARLLCTLHHDVMVKQDFAGLHRMHRTQSEVSRRMLEARRVGAAESERQERLFREAEEEEDLSEGDEEAEDDEDSAAQRMQNLRVGGDAAASSSSSNPIPEPEPVEEKTAEQLQDEADGWETVPKKGKKGGRK